jgi:hypothetical protein
MNNWKPATVRYVSNPINRINSSALLFSTTPSRNR